MVVTAKIIVVISGGKGRESWWVAAVALTRPCRRADRHPTSVRMAKLITLPGTFPCQSYIWQLSSIWIQKKETKEVKWHLCLNLTSNISQWKHWRKESERGMSQWTDSRCHTLDHQMMRRQGNKKYQRERRVEQWDRKTENSFKKMVLDKGCKGGGWIKGKMLLEQKEKLLTSKECIKKSGAVQHYIKGKSWGQSKKKKKKKKILKRKGNSSAGIWMARLNFFMWKELIGCVFVTFLQCFFPKVSKTTRDLMLMYCSLMYAKPVVCLFMSFHVL